MRKEIRDRLPVLPGVKLKFYEDSETGGDSTYFAVKFFGEDTGDFDMQQGKELRIDYTFALGPAQFPMNRAEIPETK